MNKVIGRAQQAGLNQYILTQLIGRKYGTSIGRMPRDMHFTKYTSGRIAGNNLAVVIRHDLLDDEVRI